MTLKMNNTGFRGTKVHNTRDEGNNRIKGVSVVCLSVGWQPCRHSIERLGGDLYGFHSDEITPYLDIMRTDGDETFKASGLSEK